MPTQCFLSNNCKHPRVGTTNTKGIAMKEFIEQLKLYREYILIMVALVSGCLFIINYFATKDALTSTQNELNALIAEGNCVLNYRVNQSEVSAAIANLEKERLEKLKLRVDLTRQSQDRLSSTEKLYNEEQLKQITKDFERIEKDLDGYRTTARVITEHMMNQACSKLKASKK